MEKRKYLTLFTIIVILSTLIVSSCTELDDTDTNRTIVSETVVGQNDGESTKVTAVLGDLTTSFSSMYPEFSVDDLIRESHAIIIGTVIDIMSSIEADDPSRPGETIIYTNVILEVDRYLSGTSRDNRVALWVRGGKVGNRVVIDYDEPVYTVGDNLLLFLRKVRPEYQPPDTVQASNYFRVFAGQQGRYEYVDNIIIGWDGKTLDVSEVTRKIVEIQANE